MSVEVIGLVSLASSIDIRKNAGGGFFTILVFFAAVVFILFWHKITVPDTAFITQIIIANMRA